VNLVEYDASRRGDVADLMARVWGERPAEVELEWLYERNPVRPASVLLGEEDGKVVGSVAMSFARMAIGGEELEVGIAVHLATDPAYQGRGIFSTLQAANEERVRELGVRLLLVVPTPASARVLRSRLGWTPLRPLRVWARVKLETARPRVPQLERFQDVLDPRSSGDRVLRDDAWLNWRFAEAPREYRLIDGLGYAAVGRRGRAAVVAVAAGPVLGGVAALTRNALLVAAPPPWERGRYAYAGYFPTPKRFTLLGKSLGHPLPDRPHLELGDLDFF
jgi:predicted N-acetyltransferase YhbS